MSAPQGMMGKRKRYVAVVVKIREDGVATPLSIQWNQKQAFKIQEVLDVRRAESPFTGARGVRYTVRIGKNITYLWNDADRWFEEDKILEMPC